MKVFYKKTQKDIKSSCVWGRRMLLYLEWYKITKLSLPFIPYYSLHSNVMQIKHLTVVVIETFIMYLGRMVFTNVVNENRKGRIDGIGFFCQVNSYSSFKTQVTLHQFHDVFQQFSDGTQYLSFIASAFVHALLYL